MPNKPTHPIVTFRFGKDGSVRRVVRQLPHDKSGQELAVASHFVSDLNNRHRPIRAEFLEALPEAGHDALIRVNGVDVELQVVELVDRSFMFEMTQEEYDYRTPSAMVQKKSGERPWRLDIEKRDDALAELIRKKIAKRYAEVMDRSLWLLCFTTCTMYQTEYSEAGVLKSSLALERARSAAALSASPFEEVWFTNLVTRSVRVWPPEPEQGIYEKCTSRLPLYAMREQM